MRNSNHGYGGHICDLRLGWEMRFYRRWKARKAAYRLLEAWNEFCEQDQNRRLQYEVALGWMWSVNQRRSRLA